MAVRVELWEGAFLRWSCTFSRDRLTWAELCSMAVRVELRRGGDGLSVWLGGSLADRLIRPAGRAQLNGRES